MENLRLEDLDKFDYKTHEELLKELADEAGLPNLKYNEINEETTYDYIQNIIKCGSLPSADMFRAVINFYKENLKNNSKEYLDIYDSIHFLLGAIDWEYFENYTKEELEDYIPANAGDVDSITSIFKTIYQDNKRLDNATLLKAKEAFTNVVKRGLNKEQIKLRLLAEQKVLTKELVKETRMSVGDRDDTRIDYAKQHLSENYGFIKELDKIQSPYDKLFNVSAEIADLNRQNDAINNNPKARDNDFKQYDRNQERIETLKQKLETETSKYDPRILEDAINDKISCTELELEIDQIKKGNEVKKDKVRTMPQEIVELKSDLLALRKQVKKDMKNVEQTSEYSV